jgi:hypothetical protein
MAVAPVSPAPVGEASVGAAEVTFESRSAWRLFVERFR